MKAIGSTKPSPKWEHRAWSADSTLNECIQQLSDVDVLCHCAAHVPANKNDPAEAEACLQINALARSIYNYQPISLREGLTGTFPFSGLASPDNGLE